MHFDETFSSRTKNHRRIYPSTEHNSATTDNQKSHTVINLSSTDNNVTSIQHVNHCTNVRAPSPSSSMDIRASDVIKRITSPRSTISDADEILPQTFLHRMSANFNMNSLVQTTSTSSPVRQTTHDINSTNTNNDHSTVTTATNLSTNINECEICYTSNECEGLRTCKHSFCHSCLQKYIIDKVHDGCPSLLECPHSECRKVLHPNDVKSILNNSEMYERYETFMLRRILQKNPDTRWCPYPNCDFAVLVENSHKANKFDCPACKQPFCQRCSQIWHPNLTCEVASIQRAATDPTLQMLLKSSSNGGDIRPCPRCKSPIEKLNDGSCNHIRCAICTCEFCWLCMKEVDNLHFVTPTGCTFYGKRRWSKLKSIGSLFLAWILTPVLAVLFVVFVFPILLILLPIVITRKFYQYSVEADMKVASRIVLCIIIFMCMFILTPFILILILLIGIPTFIFFIYFYMPQRYISANF